MRIESLKYFCEVARLGSYSQAARKLYISQQGLSKSIHTLEKKLGVQLFDRSGKRLHLTEAGQALVPLATTCIENYRALEITAQEYANILKPSKAVPLMTMPFITGGLFPLMRGLFEKNGLGDVILEERPLPDIIEKVVSPDGNEERVGLIVLAGKQLEALLQNEEISFVPLFNARLMLVGARALISPHKKSYSTQEIANMPVVYYSDSVLEEILGDLFSCHPLKRVIAHTSSPQLLNEYVQEGQAVTFTDTFTYYLSTQRNEFLCVVPIKDASSFSAGFIYSKKAKIPENTMLYIDRFKACLDKACESYFGKA